MSDNETEALTKNINRFAKDVIKAFDAVAFVGTVLVCIILAALAAYALYFAYGWVSSHPKQVALITGCCAFWIITNWRK